MIRSLVVGTMLVGLCGCGSDEPAQPGSATGEAARAGADGAPDLASQNLAFWAERWWNTANAEEEKGAFVDMVPTDFQNERFRVVFKQDVNDTTPREGDAPAAPSATRLDFTIGGEKKSFTMVTGAEAGVPARANRQRCIILSPEKAVYCARAEVRR